MMADDKSIVTKKTATKKAVAKKAAAKKPVAKKAAISKTAAPATKKVAVNKPPARAVEQSTTKKTPAKRSPKTSEPAALPETERPVVASTPAASSKLPEKPVNPSSPPPVSPEERLAMIQEAAYFKAEKRGFDPRFDDLNWAEAVEEVDAKLAKRST